MEIEMGSCLKNSQGSNRESPLELLSSSERYRPGLSQLG